MHHNEHEYDDFDEDWKSKTEIKNEMLALQDFGARLVKLSKHQRSKLPLTEELQEAMELADKIHNKHEALRRHIRYIGKLLQNTDIAPIEQALDVLANKHQQETHKFHQLEQMRDELITQGNEKIELVLGEHDGMERQKLRQLVRQAKKEVDSDKQGKYYRELFQYLKSFQK